MATALFLVDAFSSERFRGNPAAICLLDAAAPSEKWMQALAAEFNQPETAFVRALGGDFSLRWFTPVTEEELCGHATLATAHVLWETGRLAKTADATFLTRSGRLHARRVEGLIELDFPTEPAEPAEAPTALLRALDQPIRAYGRSRLDHLVELGSETELRALQPDMDALLRLPGRGVIVTALAASPGADFVSRYFCPKDGIAEDPVTGSAHCTLAPFWSARLARKSLVGHQLSARGGIVHVICDGPRTRLRGTAVTVFRGTLD